MKTQILAALGETGLQQGSALNAGLAANDRIKYAFSLLQMAIGHARHPDEPAASLKQERLAAGIDDTRLDATVEGAIAVGKDVRVPGSAHILQRIDDDMRLMAAPALAAALALGGCGFKDRLAALLAARPTGKDDLVDPEAISAMTHAGQGPDSLHHLVMDLHKRLNSLQAAMAQETLDGAAAYGLDAADRPMVSAFMSGVNRTSRLKFNHSGLATTATRTGGRLVIQNDIGSTDAHVIVIHVQDRLVNVTYTDVHAERLAFFQSMLKPRGFTWGAGRTATLAAGSPFYLATGQVQAADDEACRANLEFLGIAPRLPDRLEPGAQAAARVSAWGGPDRALVLGGGDRDRAPGLPRARRRHSDQSRHRGDRGIRHAVRRPTVRRARRRRDGRVPAIRIPGRDRGTLSSQSHALIQDRVRVALAATVQQRGTTAARPRGGACRTRVRTGDAGARRRRGRMGATEKRARRARSFEHDADQIVVDTRTPCGADRSTRCSCRCWRQRTKPPTRWRMRRSCLRSNLWRASRWMRCKSSRTCWRQRRRNGSRRSAMPARSASGGRSRKTEDFLAAIASISKLEHQADDAERDLAASAVQHAADFRQLHLFAAVGDKLEAAADALKKASLILREQVLEHVVDG